MEKAKRKQAVTERRKPSRERGVVRYEAILDAAEKIFSEVGYESATTNAIAEEGGIPVGSIYQFFPNKTSIYLALAERHAKRVSEVLDSVLDPGLLQLSPEESVRKTVDALYGFYVREKAYRRFMQSGTILPEQVEVHQKIIAEISTRMAGLIQLRYQLGEGESRLVARVCSEAVTALLRIDPKRSGLDGEALKEEMIRLIASYLASKIKNA
jgi:AcrR family transcriptional regulator